MHVQEIQYINRGVIDDEVQEAIMHHHQQEDK